jgi:hypothetical protein
MTRIQFAIAAFVATLLMPLGFAGAAGVHGHDCPHCGCGVCMPVETVVKERKHCWEIECKQVCVPGIKWPWDKCCEPPRSGPVKTVKVLKRVEYECEKCGYQWEIQAAGCKTCE